MKKILVPIVMMAALGFASCKPTHLDRNGLKGDVKRVTTTRYAIDEDGKQVFLNQCSDEFNEDGFIIEEAQYDQSGNLINKVQFEYVEKNILKTLSRINREGEKKVKYETIFRDGKPTRVEFDGRANLKDEFKFDGNKLVYAKLYDENGENYRTIEQRYNKHDYLIEEIDTYSFIDEQTNKVTHEMIHTERVINDDGLVTQEIYTFTSGDVKRNTTTTYTYDDDNNQIELNTKNYSYTIDKKGNEKCTDKIEEILKIVYSNFDDEGNWTKRLIFKDDKVTPCNIEERVLEYY